MAQEVSKLPVDSGRSIVDARIRRIISITAALYGLAVEKEAAGIAGGA